MHILQINAVYGIRSTGRIVKELDDYLIMMGYKSNVAYSEEIAATSQYKIGTNFEKKVHGLMSRITGFQGYFSKVGTWKLLKYMNETKPDIVHIHNLHSNFINMPMLFNYLAKNDIATVITLHDCWFYTGGHSHYITDDFYDWKNGFSKTNKDKKKVGNKSWFFDKSEKIFIDQVNWFTNIPRLFFVGVSKWITEEAKQSIVTEGSTVKTIYNWIDTSIFRPVDASTTKKKFDIQEKFIILSVASVWNKKKGLDKFIELSKKIRSDECIVLIGKIENVSGLPDNIINIPETHDITELVEYYSMADSFVNLSVEESFGKVTAESLACGTPAISIDSSANAEIIGEGCGYVVKEWNLDNILKKLDFIRYNGKKVYSNSCIKFVEKNFNAKKNLEEYKKIYKELLLKNIIKEEKL